MVVGAQGRAEQQAQDAKNDERCGGAGMKQPLIICGFPGVGKTSCERWARVLDTESSAYSHIFDPEKMTSRKNDEFPTNYIDMVESEMKSNRWDIILLSSHKSVRNELKLRKIKFVAVCPQIDCLPEYLGRYLKRGSDYDFMVDIANNWFRYISDIADEELCITLGKGQYLSDILPLF